MQVKEATDEDEEVPLAKTQLTEKTEPGIVNQVKAATNEHETYPLAKKKLTNIKQTQPRNKRKPVTNTTDVEEGNAHLSKRNKSNIKQNKTKPEYNTKKRKIRADKEEDQPAQDVEAKGVKDKPIKQGIKAKRWKGWAIVDVDEQELVKEKEKLQEVQEEDNEGEGNSKGRKNKCTVGKSGLSRISMFPVIIDRKSLIVKFLHPVLKSTRTSFI
ncbi:hypothetical protein DFH28DRAFT_925476 [Melampsora americana]|nr:hypothetical protein DFH28DRAFT_925476 [Melampsora americana]